MASHATVTIKLSECAVEFMAAALDLLCEVEDADIVLLPDSVAAAGERLRAIIEEHPGML